MADDLDIKVKVSPGSSLAEFQEALDKKFSKKAEVEVGLKLDPKAVQKEISALLTQTKTFEKSPLVLAIDTGGVKQLDKELKKAKETQKQLQSEFDKMSKELQALTKSYNDNRDALPKNDKTGRKALKDEYLSTKKEKSESRDAVSKQLDQQRTLVKELEEKQKLWNAEISKGANVVKETDAATQKQKESQEKLTQAAKKTQKEMESIAERVQEICSGIEKAVAGMERMRKEAQSAAPTKGEDELLGSNAAVEMLTILEKVQSKAPEGFADQLGEMRQKITAFANDADKSIEKLAALRSEIVALGTQVDQSLTGQRTAEKNAKQLTQAFKTAMNKADEIRTKSQQALGGADTTAEMAEAYSRLEQSADKASAAMDVFANDKTEANLQNAKQALEELSQANVNYEAVSEKVQKAKREEAKNIDDVSRSYVELLDKQEKANRQQGKASKTGYDAGAVEQEYRAMTLAMQEAQDAQRAFMADPTAEKMQTAKQSFKDAAQAVNEYSNVLGKAATDGKTQLEQVVKKATSLNTSITMLQKTNVQPGTAAAGNIERAIDTLKAYRDALIDISNGGNYNDLSQLFDAANNDDSLNQYGVRVENISDLFDVLTMRIKEAKAAESGFAKSRAVEEKFQRNTKAASNLLLMYKRYIEENERVASSPLMGTMVNDFGEKLKSGLDTGNLDDKEIRKLGIEFNNLRLQAKGLGLEGKSLSQVFKKLFGDHLGTGMVMGSIHLMRDALRQVWDNALAVDSAMTQLGIVTKASAQQMSAYFNEAAQAAKEAGASVVDTLNSATTYARLGLDNPVMLSKYTQMYANTSGSTVEDATTAVTAILKGYGKSEADIEEILSKLVNVGNKYAISASELGDGLANAGSALSSSGNNLEQSIALLAAANASVQDISKASTMLRTISTRLTGTKGELTQALEEGLDVEDAIENQSKYRDEIFAETKGAVDILAQDGKTYRATYDILNDLSKVWSTLGDDAKKVVIGDMAGTRGANVFNSIMENFEDAQGAFADASNSSGELARANEKYMDSMQAHLNQFTAAFESLSANLIDEGLVNFFVDLGTGMLGAADGATKLGLALPAVLALASGLLTMNKVKGGRVSMPAAGKVKQSSGSSAVIAPEPKSQIAVKVLKAA